MYYLPIAAVGYYPIFYTINFSDVIRELQPSPLECGKNDKINANEYVTNK